jgi:selenocysteine lyase/cysteine desulfurase
MIIRAGSLVSAARMQALRSQFPVLERLAYLNAGTNGPVPARAVQAVEASVRRQAEEGRAGKAFFEETAARADDLRGRVAALLGADTAELTLTGSTTDGVNAVLNALDLRPGDEIITSDEEHPGVLAPLARARDAYGARVRMAPFAELADAVGPDTRLVVCSHVSWLTGRVVDAAALATGGAELLLDGAQGLGALPVDVRALGCDYYAASGQKWLCGPNGVGYLYVRAGLLEGLRAPWPGYHSLLEPGDALESPSKPDARKLGNGFPAHHQLEWAHASLDVLEEAGLAALHERAARLAGSFAGRLAELGVRVAPRGRQPLVSFEAADPRALVERLASSERMVLRDLPGTPYVRASVGAWTDEDELERLAQAVAR